MCSLIAGCEQELKHGPLATFLRQTPEATQHAPLLFLARSLLMRPPPLWQECTLAKGVSGCSQCPNTCCPGPDRSMENEAKQLQRRLTPLVVSCWLLYAPWRERPVSSMARANDEQPRAVFWSYYPDPSSDLHFVYSAPASPCPEYFPGYLRVPVHGGLGGGQQSLLSADAIAEAALSLSVSLSLSLPPSPAVPALPPRASYPSSPAFSTIPWQRVSKVSAPITFST
jgi:hypothetical protein